MIPLMVLVVVAQLGPTPPAMPAPDDPTQLLEQDRQLLDLHRGYLSYLQQHPERVDQEIRYLSLSLDPQYRRSVDAFDSALERYPTLRRSYERHMAYLSSHPEVRQQVERLQRMESRPSGKEIDLSQAIGYLLARPQWATAFLSNPSQPEVSPAPLTPLLNAFAAAPDLRPQLLDVFQQLLGAPSATKELFPWWRDTGENQEEPATAYRNLIATLRQNPDAFRLWQQHALSTAETPETARWLRYWYATLARRPQLAAQYPAYVQRIEAQPDERADVLKAWAARYGPAYPWPPQQPPPPLAPLPPVVAQPNKASLLDAAKGMGVARPAPLTRPTRPAMPERPSMPERPMKPQKPLRPTRPVKPEEPTKEDQ